VKFDVENGHVTVLSDYEFHKSRYSGSHTLLKEVYEILPVISTFLFRLGYHLVLTIYV
jgi:hypothetical protein